MNNLIVLTSKPQNETVPRINTNKPEVRHKNILDELNDNDVTPIYPELQLTSDILKVIKIHDPRMIDFLENCYESFRKNPDEGYDFLENGVVPYTMFKYEPSIELIERLDYWKQAGIWGRDMMTPIFEHTWKTILESANNCYCVKDYIIKNTKQVIYCLNLYPGHHAGRDYGGYCFVNNGAVCAKNLLLSTEEFKKITILDLDYHAGDGTKEIFYNNPDVTTVSIHADVNLDYPFYDCENFTDEVSRFKDINFGPNTNLRDYLDYVRQAFGFINSQDYDAIIIAFGGDTFKNDPDASKSCRCKLDVQDYEEIGKYISISVGNKPIIITQEGGYNMENIGKIVCSFLKGLCY